MNDTGIGLGELGTLFGVLAGVLAISASFRRWVEGKIEAEQRDRNVQIGIALGKIGEVQKDLNDHKLHVSDTYATKKGVSEATDRLMRAVESLGTGLHSRLDKMNERLDRVIEDRPHRD